jgi:DNA-binding transcriptional LysR family regulator
MTFTLKQVETFRTVYETESVSSAARRLGVSPAAVSLTLASLEESIGLRLFERVRQRLVRTPEATLLYEEIRRLNVGLESLGRKIRAIKGAAQPRLRVGCIPAYSGHVISGTLARFRERFPDTPLYLQIRDSNTLRDMVVSGELDLAAVADESELDGLRGHCLAKLQAVAVFAKGHPLERFDAIAPEQLIGAGLILLNSEDAARKRLDAILQARGVVPNVAIETPYSMSICQLALAGFGIGIANPATAVAMQRDGLVFKPFDGPVHFECHLVLHNSLPLSEAGKFWIACMRETLAPLLAQFDAARWTASAKVSRRRPAARRT